LIRISEADLKAVKIDRLPRVSEVSGGYPKLDGLPHIEEYQKFWMAYIL
jgi:hypothetical protein